MPPNYVAFRYSGRLQSIHHVGGYVISDHPAAQIDGAPEGHWDVPHYFLTLGPPLKPDHPVPTGMRIRRSARVWADIDLLLSSSTITEAWERSHQRRAE